jgi:hypothetical protein
MASARDTLPENFPAQRVALVDLLDRVLAEGVVVTGDITLSIADVDLVTVSLRALLASVSALTGGTASGETLPGKTLPGEILPARLETP